MLAYPSGKLETRVDRVAVAILAVGATALNVLYSTSLTIIADKSTGLYGGLALATMTTVVVVRRWLIAPPRARRELAPVLVAGIVLLAGLIINLIRRIAELPEGVEAILLAARDLAPAAIPIALLIGFYRQSERRLQALVDAIPDRMFRFTRDGRYVDSTRADAGQRSTTDGRRRTSSMAVACTSACSPRRPDRARLGRVGPRDGPAPGLRLLARRSRPADATTRPGSRRAGRTRSPRSCATSPISGLPKQSYGARARGSSRRPTRSDDGSSATCTMARSNGSCRCPWRCGSCASGSRPATANSEAIEAADEAAPELKLAIQELRELARGIHPAILTEAGLGPAIAALAERSVVPTVVSEMPDRRLSSAVEATAYFVVSEALANVAKYASATQASVGAACRGSTLHVEVGDNGVGGADASRGSGIRGLQDRVAALGGPRHDRQPRGQGTLVVAEIPIT